MICKNCTTTETESNELPETAENGFVCVSDYLAHHLESIEAALRNSEFEYLIKFHPFCPQALWRQGAFRVYVSEEHLEAARDFCMLIEFISSPERNNSVMAEPLPVLNLPSSASCDSVANELSY
jgi:hypothetical protein